MEDKLRPQPMADGEADPSDYATESEDSLLPTNDEPSTPTR